MERVTISDIDDWFLSGQPVVRFAGRDFSQTVEEYEQWLLSLATSCALEVAVTRVVDPPGVVVQSYIPGDEVPVLPDPMIKVSKGAHPWLFCIYHKCRNRVTTPGMECEAHR